jgi:hypothetical protein
LYGSALNHPLRASFTLYLAAKAFVVEDVMPMHTSEEEHPASFQTPIPAIVKNCWLGITLKFTHSDV